MIIRIDENESETVVYRVRIFLWSTACVFYYVTQLLEITAVPFVYRKFISHKKHLSLKEWLLKIQSFWCKKEVYKASTKVILGSRRLTPGYFRHIRGF